MESGPTSRCFERRLGSAPLAPSCLNMRCDTAARALIVTYASLAFACPSGGEIDVSQLLYAAPPPARLTFKCPVYEEMCSTSVRDDGLAPLGDLMCGANAHCSARGQCYKGVCYCVLGWIGCGCELQASSTAGQQFDSDVCGRWQFGNYTSLDAGVQDDGYSGAPVPYGPQPSPADALTAAATTLLCAAVSVCFASIP